MAYTTNRFCWHGLMTTDPAKAAAFYPEVLGWKASTMEMGGSESTMFSVSDVPVAHYMEPPVQGIPSHWTNYIRVDDVDASTKLAVENGGTQLMAPTDIPVGRFSTIASPSGAAVCLFHEADEATSEHHPGGTGGVHWTELNSTDIESDMVWLKKTFGYESSEMPMPDNGTYYILSSKAAGEHPCGGAMAQSMEGAPSAFLTWFSVDDADAAAERVKSNGGNVLSPMIDMPGTGRMVVVQDPTGGVFGVIKPEA